MPIEERIQEIDVEVRELLDELNYIKEELKKNETKQHKSLSDYRVYEELKEGEEYKFISYRNDVGKYYWNSDNVDCALMDKGNMYSIDTPDELLEREVKKRQLWFALEKHLKEKGCLATSEYWKNGDVYKYFAYFNCSDGTVDTDVEYDWKTNAIYSTNDDILKKYMHSLSYEDIKIMFDVE